MGIWKSLGGLVAVRVTSAEPCGLLHTMAQKGVVLNGVSLIDPLTADFVVRRKDLRKAERIVSGRGDKLEVLRVSGIFWRLKSLLRRKLLLGGCAALLFLALYMPTRVLFIQVEGNSQVPSALILEAASQCGIYFGADREAVRSERVKNELLQAIPQLQWVGVNTAGCSATISVRERTEADQKEERYAVSRIVACRDGVISTAVCTAGNLLCSPGQVVREGQTLISGYTDCGLSIRADRAQGEIFAFTERQITAVLPAAASVRGEERDQLRRYSLVIGKKRINLWKDSGISCASCVKIYEEKWVSLPGGYRLPVKLEVETWLCCDISEQDVTTAAEQQLKGFCAGYVGSGMLSGTILQKQELVTQEEACLTLQGKYECLEMIGRERSEEIVHGKND